MKPHSKKRASKGKSTPPDNKPRVLLGNEASEYLEREPESELLLFEAERSLVAGERANPSTQGSFRSFNQGASAFRAEITSARLARIAVSHRILPVVADNECKRRPGYGKDAGASPNPAPSVSPAALAATPVTSLKCLSLFLPK